MLIDGDVDANIDKSMRGTMKSLDEMEVVWSTNQKEKKKEQLMESLKKKRRTNNFHDQTIAKCKNHNGSVTSASKLKALVNQKSPDSKKYLCQENNTKE